MKNYIECKKTGLPMDPLKQVRNFLLAGLALMLVACGGSSGSSNPANQYFVDAVVGDDGNDGSSTTPFKTVGMALSVAVSGELIQVQPGIYDVANGETFPLTVPDGVYLRGDEGNKGNGSTATLVEGNGDTGDGSQFATLISGQGSTVSGLSISAGGTTVRWYGLFNSNTDAEITNNTFLTSYGGVRVQDNGNPNIRDNIFETSSYGINATPLGTVAVESNSFTTPTLAINTSGSGNLTIINNTILGGGTVGIQFYTLGTASLIENNTFTRTSYSAGALRTGSTSSPVVRSNIFNIDSGNIIRINNTATPDLGTAIDSGNNIFNTIAAISVAHEGTSVVTAIGNTWPSATPVCGTDIVNTNTGSITWGTGGGESCP